MIKVKFDFFSEILKRETSINLLLPQKRQGGSELIKQPFPVLYLLHGLGDNQDTWLRRSCIESAAAERNLALVMPSTDRGFYTDTTYGTRYYTYISEELPEILHRHFPLSQRREETFAAGLSMGGYGALKLALRNPERFYAAISLSGAPIGSLMLEAWRREHSNAVFMNEMVSVFGETVAPENDVFSLLEKGAEKAQKPRLFLCCGETDGLFALNQALLRHAERYGYYVFWSQEPGAGHEWPYWNKMTDIALDWLPLPETNG